MTRPPLLAMLTRKILPRARHVSWHDLAEQIALERGVDVDSLLHGKAQRAVAARRHFFGALVGAGLTSMQIGRVIGVGRQTVDIGIKIAFEAMGGSS